MRGLGWIGIQCNLVGSMPVCTGTCMTVASISAVVITRVIFTPLSIAQYKVTLSFFIDVVSLWVVVKKKVGKRVKQA